MLVDRETGVIYLIDWGSAVKSSGTALPFEGTVHFLAACVLNQVIVNSQAAMFTSADVFETLVCSAFCLCHPTLQAQLHGISKMQVNQLQDWWQHTVWQQRLLAGSSGGCSTK